MKAIPASASPDYVKRLDGPNVKRGASKLRLGEALREDIRRFIREHGCDRAVVVWCASTEIYLQPSGCTGGSIGSRRRWRRTIR